MGMTLSQLQSFAAVARLGSVKAAARDLGVSEPAVSAAVAALRREVGDQLYAPDGRGVVLTAGGRRLEAIAIEMLGLADQARRGIAAAEEGGGALRVVATNVVAEHGGESLIDAFAARFGQLQVTLEEEPGASFAELLERRRADVALGPRPSEAAAGAVEAVPCLRCRIVIVAAPGHPLAGRPELPATALAGERWLVGPSGVDRSTAEGRFLDRHLASVPAEAVQAYGSERAALGAAQAGEGIMLAVGHGVREQVRRRALVVLDVRGMPLVDVWHASALPAKRSIPAARALQRFAATPEGMQAFFGGRGWVPAARFRPPVHVTLWRSVGDGSNLGRGMER